jgi:O-antigen ligase
VAFAGVLLFILLVYANPANWFEATQEVPFAKAAAGLSLLALALSWLLYERRLYLGGMLGWTLLCLFALVGLSSTWSYWPKYSFDAFIDGLKYLAVFFVVANVVDSRERLATTVAVLGFASLFPAFGAIWSYYHGEHLVEGDRAAWIGIFGNPNDLAYHLVVGLALMLAAREHMGRRWRVVGLVALAPVAYALVLTRSRGGMFAACVVVAMWLLRSLRRAPLFVGAAVALACVLMVGPSNPWRTRTASSTVHGEDVSARGRVDAWRTGVNMAKQRPFTGVGAGAFVIAWPDFAPGDAGPARTEHNTFIQLVSELGVGGLALFVTALLVSVLGLSRPARIDRDLQGYARGVQFGMAGFALCSLWGGIAWTWPFYLLAGLSVAIRRLAEASEAIVQPHHSHGAPASFALGGGG